MPLNGRFRWDKQSQLFQGLRDHGWPLAGQLPAPPKPQHTFADEAEEKRHARIVGQKKDFNNLVTAYGHEAMHDLYRFLCGYTHPSGISASAYLHQAGDGAGLEQ